VNCPICPFSCRSEKRKELLTLWDTLSSHICQNHIQEAGYSYTHLFKNNCCGSVSPLELIYKLTNYRYEGLELVCKSWRHDYSFHYSNYQKLTVEVVTKGRSPELPFAFLDVNELSEFYCLLAVIAYTLNSNQKTMEKSIHVFTSHQP
jgi:hypothetical protein